jgi:integrase
MATVRRRTWQTKDGPRTAWVVDYFDGTGTRRLKTFERQREAKDWLAQTQVDVKAGEHVADRASVTVAQAAAAWLEESKHGSPDGERKPVRPSTLREYERHVAYITDSTIGIGQIKLNKLDRPVFAAFLRRLRDAGHRAPMARKVKTTMSSILALAKENKQVGQNVLVGQRRRRGSQSEEREIVIPTKAELRAMLEADGPLWFRAFLATAIWAGMRSSELRGLDWRHVDLDVGTIKVRQMADFAGHLQPPKSKAGTRDIPMTPRVRKLLSELHLARGRPTEGFVFATRTGRPLDHANIVQRHYEPLQRRRGMEGPKLDIDDKPVLDRNGKPRLLYGLHELRHAAASLFIERVDNGERGWTAKKVQVLMGHSSIKVTYDVYGKLFKDGDGDQAAMAELEAALLG